MAPHDSLPDDQRAILQLLLKQGKTYDELATLLKRDPATLRRLAHDAVDALGPSDAAVDVGRRHEVADYLLGQQSASQRAATREYLEESSAGRAWARGAAGGLRPLGGTLPDVPAEPAELDEAFDALDRRTERQEEVKRSSQTGGRLIFAGLGLVLAIVLLFVFGAFDGDDKKEADAPTVSTETTEAPVQYEPLQTAIMKASKGSSSKGEAIAVIARKAGTQDLSLALQASKLQESSSQGSAYAVWLYTSPTTAQFISFPTQLVGKEGTLEAAFQLPKDTASYREVLLTRETREKPTKPGTIILRGPLELVPESARQPTQTQPQP